MATPVRRIVTGHDANGRSVFLQDGPAPRVFAPQGMPSFALTELWQTTRMPASNRGVADAAGPELEVTLPPPRHGTMFRIVEFPPDQEMAGADVAAVFEEFGGGHALDRGQARHPGMHKTATVDYALVIEGEIWAMMDEGETLMRPGDVLIQRGTNHAWSNRSNAPCRVAFILIDAEPV
jgi:hypothetical protein